MLNCLTCCSMVKYALILVSVTCDVSVTVNGSAIIFRKNILSLFTKPHEIPSRAQQENFEASVTVHNESGSL